MIGRRIAILVAASLLYLAASAQASPILVTTRSGLNANDAIDWGQLGPELTTVSAPAALTSNLGLPATLDAGPFSLRLDQGSQFFGNFAPGDHLLFAFPGPIEIDFASPVRGAGAQFQNGFGAITVQLSAYDSVNNLLGQFSFVTNTGLNQDNSAVFGGILDSAADISRLVINSPGPGNRDINMNTLSLNTRPDAVPEPASVLLVSAGLALARRRARASRP